MSKPETQLPAKIKKTAPKHAYFDEIQGKRLLVRLEGVRQSSGAKYASKYFTGAMLTLKQAILANCAECMGWYADGMRDCEVHECPLYHWMPYRAGRKRYIRKERRKEQPCE